MTEQPLNEAPDLNPIQPRNAAERRAAIDRLILLAEEAVDTNPGQALQLAEQAAAACRQGLFEKKPYLKGLARSYHAAGSASINQGKFGEALKFHSDSLAVFREIKERKSIVSQLNNVGIVFAYSGDYAEALKYMRAAENLMDGRISLRLKAEILNNIGFTYVALGEFANAIPILLTSLKTARRIKQAGPQGRQPTLANIYDSLCQAYLAGNDLENALEVGLKSTSLCRELGDLKKEAEYLLILGEVYSRMEQPGQAAAYFQQTLDLARTHGFRREEAEAYRRLGILHTRQGNYARAAGLLGDALALAEEIKMQREVYECHHALAMLHRAAGEFEQALDHYERFHQIKETVFNDQSDQRIKNLEILHQVDQAHREAEIHQKKSIELQKEVVERRKAQTLAELLASTDALTGIYNRRKFFSLAAGAVAEALASRAPLGLILLDVDHFKAINDRCGHLEGDRVLAELASRISANLRKEDIIGRYGGEEFVAALPHTNMELCQLIAERLRSAVEAMEIKTSCARVKVTISLGLAGLEGGAEGEAGQILERLLGQADQAMYAAKRLGRNRVEVLIVE